MKKVRINVRGRVQGVGFRYMTKITADKLGIKGAVKNEFDGSVTIEAIGDETTLEKFIEAIKESPSPSGKVTQTQIQEDDTIQERASFDVEYGY